jgi:3-oxoacyl-[acyl-carrier-protein] synthase II
MTDTVWVTGIGAVSAAGIGATQLGEMLIWGRTGVRPIPWLGSMPAGMAPTPPSNPAGRYLDRSARFFLQAAEEAWHDAGLEDSGFDARRCAVLEGSSLGPLADLLTEHTEQPGSPARPSRLIRYMTGAGGAVFGQLHGVRGPVLHLSAGSISAAYAIAEGVDKILSGRIDVAIVGGAECPLHPEVLASFDAAGILGSRDPGDAPCRPFDARRQGTVLGEGAGILVLEASGHARRRGARPRAVVRGYGMSCESYRMTSPDPSDAGVAEAARDALAQLAPEDLGWIKAHGAGTRLNDAAECRGLASLLGEALTRIPIASLKPALGHCLGASAAIEMVGTVLALEWGLVPPTLGHEQADPDLPPLRVENTPRAPRGDTALLLSESFGGRCVALALSLAEGGKAGRR